MVDVVDKATRSRMMAGIRSKDTRPELMLRRALHARNLRYRVHSNHVPGRPDIVFARRRAVIFVHGCFWHRHQSCRYATTPTTRPEFWQGKFAANVARDDATLTALREAGWRVAVIWECALRGAGAAERTADLVATWLDGLEPLLEIGTPQEIGA